MLYDGRGEIFRTVRFHSSSLSSAHRRTRSRNNWKRTKEKNSRPRNDRTKSCDVARTFPWRPRNDLPGLVVKRYRRSTHGRHNEALIIARDCPYKRAPLFAVKGPRDLDIYKRRERRSSRLDDQVYCGELGERNASPESVGTNCELLAPITADK